MKEFKCLGKIVTNPNYIQEEAKQIEVRKYLLSFGAEFFVLRLPSNIEKYKN